MASSVSADPEARVPIVGTKLQAPASVSRYRERARISALLDRGLEDSTRLTLVSAPPGYGKTVAVTRWLASRGLPQAWLSLDAADNDLARFVRYLVAALAAVRPGFGEATLGLLPAGVSTSVDQLGAALLDEIAAIDDPFVLVLDDYQVVSAEPVHRVVRLLIERGPPFVHLVVLTRADPPLPLARLRAHGHLVEVRADDLRCNSQEVSPISPRPVSRSRPNSSNVFSIGPRAGSWASSWRRSRCCLPGPAATRIEQETPEATTDH